MKLPEIPWDEIQEKLRENLEFKMDTKTRTITIRVKGEIPEGIPVKDLMKGGEGLQHLANLTMDEEITFTVEELEEDTGMRLHFEDDESLQRMYTFLDGIVNGDLLKEILEKMMAIMFEVFGADLPKDLEPSE